MTHTTLKQIRERRALSASALAALAGVARQTIYAIESGAFVPNTQVALQLAHVLDVSVEEIFQLHESSPPEPSALEAELIDDQAEIRAGQLVRLWRIGRKRIALPIHLQTPWIPYATGRIVSRTSPQSITARTLSREDPLRQVVVAGCDPAVSVLSRFLAAKHGVDLVPVPSSSSRALQFLKEGKVHVAGMHLRDPETGDFNLPFVRRMFPRGGFRILTYANWRQGFVVAPGNPRGIRSVKDLIRRHVTFINREKGSGSRDLLDALLIADSVDPRRIRGYRATASGHLAAARAVADGSADCCIANTLAASALGLDFIPLATERYDFVTLTRFSEQEGIKALFDALNRTALRGELEALASYDVNETGMVRA